MPEHSIPFTRPYQTGRESTYLQDSLARNAIASEGFYTQRCTKILETTFGIAKALMTPSCTAALELAAMLCDLQPGDEVILPSYTFTSTANAFVLQGASPVFVDVRPDTLNLDETLIEQAITQRTKVICPVHYAGIGCEMDKIMEIANRHGLIVVEDAAQGVHAYYKGRALGSIGHLGAYSFHETKNYVCGEGGALCINDPRFSDRAEILREKGTNRSQFFRGVVDKYTWVDSGSSYLPAELACAYLAAQLEHLDQINAQRQRVFEGYKQHLSPLFERGRLRGPVIPEDCIGNHHMYYVLAESQVVRDQLMHHLRERGISAVFHYLPLHTSPMGRKSAPNNPSLPVTEDLAGRLLRLPLFGDLTDIEVISISSLLHQFFNDQK
jgi:dTDP-4-amino-4,6-dideoxygalactose transaminase